MLFLISCSSNEAPTPNISELVGTWEGYDETYRLEFKVDSDGNITFSPKPAPNGYGGYPYTYTGKIIDDTFDYPYTAEVSYYGSGNTGFTIKGIFTFNNSSSCTANYDRLDSIHWSGKKELTRVTISFTK